MLGWIPEILECYFLYERKSKHNTARAVRNINTLFRNVSVNDHTIRRWYAKFETGDESLTNKDQDRTETVVDNEIFRATVEKRPGNTVRGYAKELGLSPTIILHHLKLIRKVIKIHKWSLMNRMKIRNANVLKLIFPSSSKTK